MMAVYPGAEYWADETAKTRLLAAYVRRKTWEASLLWGRGNQAGERIHPSAMIDLLGGM